MRGEQNCLEKCAGASMVTALKRRAGHGAGPCLSVSSAVGIITIEFVVAVGDWGTVSSIPTGLEPRMTLND